MKLKRVLYISMLLTFFFIFGTYPVCAGLPATMAIKPGTSPDLPDIEVTGFGHNVSLVIDPVTGQFTGKRRHTPIQILKKFDSSSILLYQFLVEGKLLEEVMVRFYLTDNTGQRVHYFSIELKSAMIIKIAPSFPPTFLPENADYEHMEIVSFCYRDIRWIHIESNNDSQDSWTQPPEL